MLRDLWERRGFSLRGFAKETGLSRETLRLYGSGARRPSNKALLRILSALSIDPASDEAQAVFSCVQTARGSELMRTPTNSNLERKLDLLTDLFFEHSDREKTDALAFFIRQKFREIEEGFE